VSHEVNSPGSNHFNIPGRFQVFHDPATPPRDLGAGRGDEEASTYLGVNVADGEHRLLVRQPEDEGQLLRADL